MTQTTKMNRTGWRWLGQGTGRIRSIFDPLTDLMKLLVRFLARIFGWPLRAFGKLAERGGGGRPGAAQAAEQERAQRRAELEQPAPSWAPNEHDKAVEPARMVPLMKEYLRTTDQARRAELAERLVGAKVLPYLEHLSAEERSAFLLTPSTSLRKHFAGQLPARSLPIWDPAHDYVAGAMRVDDQPVVAAPLGSAVPTPRPRARDRDAARAEVLKRRTAQLMQRQQMSEGTKGKFMPEAQT